MLRWCGAVYVLVFLEYAMANDNVTVTSASEQPSILRQWWTSITEFVTGQKPEGTAVASSSNMTHHNATPANESTTKTPVATDTTDIFRIMKDIVKSDVKNQSSAGGNVDRDAKCLPPVDVAATRVNSQNLLQELQAVFSDILNGTLNVSSSQNATTVRRNSSRLNESNILGNTILRIGKELQNVSERHFYYEFIHFNRSRVKVRNGTKSSINKITRALFTRYFGIERNQSLNESSKDRLARYLTSVHSENMTGNDRLNGYLTFLRRYNWTYNGYARYLYNLSEARREDRAFGDLDYYPDYYDNYYVYGDDYFFGRSAGRNKTNETAERDARQLRETANNTASLSSLHSDFPGNKTEPLRNLHVELEHSTDRFSLKRNNSRVPDSNATTIIETHHTNKTFVSFFNKTLGDIKTFPILNSTNKTRADSLDSNDDLNLTTKAIFKHPGNKSNADFELHVFEFNKSRSNKSEWEEHSVNSIRVRFAGFNVSANYTNVNVTAAASKTNGSSSDDILLGEHSMNISLFWNADRNVSEIPHFHHKLNNTTKSNFQLKDKLFNDSFFEGQSVNVSSFWNADRNVSKSADFHHKRNITESNLKLNDKLFNHSFFEEHSMNVSSFWNTDRNVSKSDVHRKRINITESSDRLFNSSFLEHSTNISSDFRAQPRNISSSTDFNHTHVNVNKNLSKLNESVFDESFLKGNSIEIGADNKRTNTSGAVELENINWVNGSVDSEVILDEENGTHIVLTIMVENDNETTNFHNDTEHHNITQDDLNLLLKFIKGNLTKNATIEPYSYNASVGSHYDPMRPKDHHGHEINIHLQDDVLVPPPPVSHVNAPNTWFNQPPFIWHQPSGGYRVYLPPPLHNNFPSKQLPALKLVCPPTSTQKCPFYIVAGMRKCYVPMDCPRAGQLCCRVGCGVECTDGILVPIPTHFY